MTQAELSFTDPVRIPTARKTKAVLMAMAQGRRLTVAIALNELGVYALSQEVGRVKDHGWTVHTRTIEVSPGVHVSEYWMDPIELRQAA